MPDSIPNSAPAAFLVSAKPASQSRTLRFNNIVMCIGGLAAFVPDILSFVISLLGDPTVASAVSGAVPMKYRAAFGVIMVIVGQRNKNLRRQTSQPIAKDGAP